MGGRDGRGNQKPGWNLEPGHLACQLHAALERKQQQKNPKNKQKTPLKLHLLLISKMQLFCSEEENTIKGRQTTTQQLAISHMSTLGQHRDIPPKNSLQSAGPGHQPKETGRT